MQCFLTKTVCLAMFVSVAFASWLDYVGLDVSTAYQSTPVSDEVVGEILKLFPFKKFRLYAGVGRDATAHAIAEAIPDASLHIQISNEDVESLDEDTILSFLSAYESIKSNVHTILLGNEPEFNAIEFSVLPSKLQLLHDTLQDTNDPDWQNVTISIPFSASLFSVSYPVYNSKFMEPSGGAAATFAYYGVCDNCVDSNTLGNSSIMYQILTLFDQWGSPFEINLFPFFACMHEYETLLPYCLGNVESEGYGGMLEAQVRATQAAMADLVGWEKAESMAVLVSETGWPTNGTTDNEGNIANIANGQDYFENLFGMMNDSNSFLYNVEVFVFELFDEYKKSETFNWEQYWGIIDDNGCGKYDLPQIGLNKGYYAGGTGDMQCDANVSNVDQVDKDSSVRRTVFLAVVLVSFVVSVLF